MLHPSDYGVLRAFAAVADQRSFSRAAELLGVSPSALSQAIRGLEERVGTRLLHRTTRNVAPTEAGERLLAGVRPALEGLATAFDGARRDGASPAGTVRIHCFHAAAEQFVCPILAKLTRDYPRIVLDITVDDTVVDLVEGGFDAAIRLGEVIEHDMVVLPLGGEIRQVAIAAPAYLARHGTPEEPHDLLGHQCIRWRWPGQKQPYDWEFSEDGRWFAVAVEGPLIANDRSFVLQAALDGIGVAFLKEASVAQFVADGQLVMLLDRWSAPFPGFHLCYPRQRISSRAVQAVVDAITSGANDAQSR